MNAGISVRVGCYLRKLYIVPRLERISYLRSLYTCSCSLLLIRILLVLLLGPLGTPLELPLKRPCLLSQP